jgi:hypothetical protein
MSQPISTFVAPTQCLTVQFSRSGLEERVHCNQEPIANAALGHELFRRALVHQAEDAWRSLYAQFQRHVVGWVNAQLAFPVDAMTMQTLVDDAFLKMAGTFRRHPEKFAAYPNVAVLLGLLRLCAQRVVQDYVTSLQQQVPVVALDAIEEPMCAPTPAPSDLWHVLERLLHNEQERLVVTCLMIEETKPRRLLMEHPGLFQDVDAINTIRERVKTRLQRNHAFRHYLCNHR